MIVSPLIAQEKLKTIYDLKVPKGFKGFYDKFENIYCVTAPWSGFTRMNNIDFRYKNTGKGFYPIIDMVWFDTSWLWVESSTLYIENDSQKILEYNVIWANQNTEVIKNYVFEKFSTTDKKYVDFLVSNLRKDSTVTIRFHGKDTWKTYELSKKQVSKIFVGIEYYKQLKEVEPTQ